MRLAEQGQRSGRFRCWCGPRPPASPRPSSASAAATWKASACRPAAAQGARWLERAGNQGYVEAQALLATLFVHGLAPMRPVRPAPPAGLFSANAASAARLRRRREMGAPRRRGRLRRRPGLARLHPDLGPGEPAQPGRGAALVRAIGQGRLPAGPSGLRAGAWRGKAPLPNPRRCIIEQSAARPPKPACPPRSICSGMITERGLGVPADPAAAAALLSAVPRRRAIAAPRRAGAWPCSKGVASRRPIRPRANRGCDAPRWPAIRRPRRWSAISMPRAASCRPISPRPRSGSAAPPRRTTAAPPARWACCT